MEALEGIDRDELPGVKPPVKEKPKAKKVKPSFDSEKVLKKLEAIHEEVTAEISSRVAEKRPIHERVNFCNHNVGLAIKHLNMAVDDQKRAKV